MGVAQNEANFAAKPRSGINTAINLTGGFVYRVKRTTTLFLPSLFCFVFLFYSGVAGLF